MNNTEIQQNSAFFNSKYYFSNQRIENKNINNLNLKDTLLTTNSTGSFPAVSTGVEREDLQRIIEYLSDPQAMMVELRELNAWLTQFAKLRGMYDATSKGLVGYRDGQHYKNHKLLSSFFYAWAQSNGFASSIRLDKVLSDDEFFAKIRGGHLFKDKVFAGDFHGEWTHFIQWFCVVERYKKMQAEDTQVKKTKFIRTDPVKLFRWIGEHGKLWGPSLEDYGTNPIRTGKNFISIQDLNAFLLSEDAQEELLLLHQALKGRALKFPPSPLAKLYPRNYRPEQSGARMFKAQNKKNFAEIYSDYYEKVFMDKANSMVIFKEVEIKTEGNNSNLALRLRP